MDKALLKKYFQNHCTPDEAREVEAFLRQSEAQDMLDKVLDEDWTTIGEPVLDEAVRDAYRNRFLAERAMADEKKIRHLQRRRWLSYAASILVVLGIGSYFFTSHLFNPTLKVAMLERSTPNGQRSTLILPDSSKVYLGPGSKVTYPERFTSETREISLEGEAFFEVKKDPDHAFIIHTGGIRTRVLGTSFRVTALKGYDVTVGVATGKVRVETASTAAAQPAKQLAVLEPGEQVRYDETTGKAVTGLVSVADLEGWKSGNVFFGAETLATVAAVLERTYNVHISITDQDLRNFEVNASFNADEPIDKVLRILGATAGFDYTTVGNNIAIKLK